ncbi:MAG: glycosyltransferase family 8 protein [Rickettsiales bacterium]|jgi:lipopolysaccharide biosynthesis glycosyltransferase|nr:glycosyltransferase family 8 protein [Rickettsiales bacterium]
MNKNYVNFALGFDRNFLMPALVMMKSVVQTLAKNRTARFFILSADLTDDDKSFFDAIKSDAVIEIISIKKYMHYFSDIDVKKSDLGHINTLGTYFRLLIPVALPDDVDKCFYMDTDIIVNSDISEIYDAFPSDKLMAAGIEVCVMVTPDYQKHLKQMDEFTKFNKNPEKYPYFNAGVFILNLKMARDMGIMKKWFDYLGRHPNPRFVDQDILNAVCGQKHSDKMVYLPYKYNAMMNVMYPKKMIGAYYPPDEIVAAVKNPVVSHFVGGIKPWLVMNYANGTIVLRKQKMFGAHKKWWAVYDSLGLPKNLEHRKYLKKFYITRQNNKFRIYLFGYRIVSIKI